MSITFFFLMIVYLLFLWNKIDGSKTHDHRSKNVHRSRSVDRSKSIAAKNRPVLQDSTGGVLEEMLALAIGETVTPRRKQSIDVPDSPWENVEVEEDDAHVPISLTNSAFDEKQSDDVDGFTLTQSLLDGKTSMLDYFSISRVDEGQIPADITVQNYSSTDRIKLMQWYQSDRHEDIKALLQFISQNIHKKYFNCVVNLGKWIQNPRSTEPIFYRNCVPCTNAVDLNLQSLFDHQIGLTNLKHYFVNTCDMGKDWVSYVTQMDFLTVDLKKHPTTTFTDVIRQNLIPNQRYVLQGIVRTGNRLHPDEGFLHACNLINDERGHLWIIDGQIERVFDLDQANDVNELDQRYRADYISRASTGIFRFSQRKND